MDIEKTKLFDSELKIMESLWRYGELTAKQIAELLAGEIGWNKNTTYTVIKKCIDKGAIERMEPNFLCRPLILKEEVQKQEVNNLVHKMFDGSVNKLFACLMDNRELSDDMIEKLKQVVNDEEM